MGLDITTLLLPVSEDRPSGDDIEYDPEFQQLERIFSKQDIHSEIALEAAEWSQVYSQSQALLGRSKDLRLAYWLTQAATARDGWSGFAQGVSLMQQLISGFWEHFHPQLDPSDNFDPVIRINIVGGLNHRLSTISLLLKAPLVHVKGLGAFNLRDYQIATGEITAPSDTYQEGLSTDVILAALQEMDPSELQQITADVKIVSEQLQLMDTFLMEKVGSSIAPDLSALNKCVTACLKFLGHAPVNQVSDDMNDQSAEGAETLQAANGSLVKPAKPAVAGEIMSREDAMKMMDKIADYFVKHEPSSPVPMLMKRAKRLSTMDFMDILKELAPKGVEQAQMISGEGE